jgi:fatty-acyl-CoA synthase
MFVPLSVLEFRDRAVRYFGDKVGVVDGAKRFTYREYGERTHRLANALRDLGIGPGDRVSFVSFNTHHLLEAYYGVLEAGAILNPINVRLAPHEIAYILDHAGARVLFYQADLRPLVEGVVGRLRSRPILVVLEGETGPLADHEYEALLAAASPAPLDPPIDENAIAELFYTSGTTGLPKGVALTHRALHLHALYALLGLGLDDTAVVLHVVPLFHVNGWGAPHWLTVVGGRHVMLRKFDPLELFRLVETERVTHLLGVPTIFNAILNHPERSRFDLSSLRLAIIGGAPASPALVANLEEALGVRAMSGYGLTETSPVLTLAVPRAHLEARSTPQESQGRRAWTGWPIPGVQLRVIDQQGRDVPADGETLGEIVVRSNVVMEGYYRDPEATAEAFRDGWFHTGDIAVVDADGYVLIKDRAKDIIIRGGENISSVEIENAIASHPGVYEVAVVAAPDEQWGESPVAFVVPKPGVTLSTEELVDHCRRHLAGFKIPREFIMRESLPKGGTGKILKSELREPLWAGREKRVS